MIVHIETLNKIKEETTSLYDKYAGKSHSMKHILAVANNAKEIAKNYDLDNNLLEAICFLHDLTYTKYKSRGLTYLLESHYVSKLLKTYLENFEISNEDKHIIINACKRHPHSVPFRDLNKEQDLYTQILQDADTIDYFNKERFFSLLRNKKLLTKMFNPVINLLGNIFGDDFPKYFMNLKESKDLLTKRNTNARL